MKSTILIFFKHTRKGEGRSVLTYDLSRTGQPLYLQLYRAVRADILSGALTAGEKLPSKRALAQHLEVSVATVQNAYEQLLAEGYIDSMEKRGYFVRRVEAAPVPPRAETPHAEAEREWFMDLATNSVPDAEFPFTVWTRLLRRTLLEQDKKLLRPVPFNGVRELREAIAEYLRAFRGMSVDPEQIIVGAGTEFLYHLLIELLGRKLCYAVEDPGYGKIAAIYRSNEVSVVPVPLDREGLSLTALERTHADVAHISPAHHYPTGLVMPIGRRQALLRWAGDTRYILEDDYDSEFRFTGRPIPPLFASDTRGRVVYLNTFSKTLAPSLRIAYMVLPPPLLQQYRARLRFYACTVPAFEQYTLALFMRQGYFERHISRMRSYYRRKRDAVIAAIAASELRGRAEIMEQDAGLHFLLRLDTVLSDDALRRRAAQAGLRLALLSDYYADPDAAPRHVLVVNYTGIELRDLAEALHRLAQIVQET